MSKTRRFHPAWIAALVTFFTLIATAGFRSAPSVLVIPLEDAFGWGRDQISFAISVNVLLYGLAAPFAVFAASIANRWFVEKRGLVIGILTAAGATGQLIFLPGLAYLSQSYGWKSISWTIALASIVMVPIIALFLREKPADIGFLPYGAPADWVEPAKNEMSAAKLTIVTLKEASAHKDFWYLVGSFFICGFSTSGLIGTHFIPAAYDNGMAQTTAASLLALVGVFDVIGTLFSGWLTDRYDPRKLLFFYYALRGVSLFLLPSVLFSSVHPSTLVFVIFYGLDWVATVPPTVILCRTILGPERGTIIYGWVFAAHQIGGAIAAYGAAVTRAKFGDYTMAFYLSGALCIITSYFVLQIAKNKDFATLRR